MSLDYFILCRENPPPRAGGWDGTTVGAAQVSEVPVEESAPGFLMEGASFLPVTILSLSVSASRTHERQLDATLDCARRITDLTHGELWYEDGPELEYAARPTDVRADQLDAWFAERLAHAEYEIASSDARARADYDAARAADPTAFAEADDWSDVLSDD